MSLFDVLRGVKRQLDPFDQGATYKNPYPKVGGGGPNVAQRAVAQINPFDNGRTWQNPHPTNQGSVIHQLTNSGAAHVVAPFANVARDTAAGAYHVGMIAPNEVRAVFDLATGNRRAAQSAFHQAGEGVDVVKQFAQGIPRQAVQLAESVNPYGGDVYKREIRPTNAAQRLFLGDQPIPTIQKAYKDTARTQGVGRARSGAALTALMDAAAIKGGAEKLEEPATKVAKKQAETIKDLAGGNPRPHRNISDAEVRAVERVRQAQSGWGNELKPTDTQVYARVAKKLGAKGVNDVETIDNAIGRIKTYQSKKAVNEGGYVRLGGSSNADLPGEAGTSRTGRPKSTPSLSTPESASLKLSSLPTYSPAKPQNVKAGGFTTSVKNSPEVSAEIRKNIKSDYVPRSTKELAQRTAKGQPVDTINEALAVPLGHIDDTTVASAITTAKKLDAAGKHDAASAIYEGLDEHLRAQGQSVQAASLLTNRTPEGLQFKAERDLRKAGVKMTPELRMKMQSAMDEVKRTPSGTPEHDYAVKKYQKVVADQFPSTTADKLTSVWKAGLLTGVKTQTGNILSNSTFGALHDISNPLAAGIDRAFSLFTGKRTKTLTERGRIAGTGEGVKAGYRALKTGIDERAGVSNKFEVGEVNFKNKAVKTYVNGVFRLMAAADRPFWYSQFRNSLADLARAEAKNTGKTVAEVLKNPTKQMLELAKNEADKSVLANDTWLSHIATGIRQSADRLESPIARNAASATVNVLAPFTKVPSAFLSRVVDFTPAGAVKEAAIQISKGHLDQRALSTALSEATTGTAVAYLGMQLAQHGQLSGAYPDDPREQQRWKAEGIQPNSVRIGGRWVSMNYLGPVGMLFNAGARAQQAQATGAGGASQVGQAFAGMPKDLTQQSFLQGTNAAISAVNDPGRYAGNFVKQQAGSVVPTLVGDVANATDPYQRDVNNVPAAIESRIPGVRQSLPVKQDVYGNPLERKAGPLDVLGNPFRPSNVITSPVLREVARLHNVDPNNRDLQVTPTPVQKTVNFDGVPTKLSDQQRYDLQKRIGQQTQQAWSWIMNTPEYQALDDIGKANALTRLRQDSQSLAMRQYASENGLGQYSAGFDGHGKQATAKLTRLGQGDPNAKDYTGAKTVSTKKKTATHRHRSTTRRTTTRRTTGRRRATFKAPARSYRPTTVSASVQRLLGRSKSIKAKTPVFKVARSSIKAPKPKGVRKITRQLA